MKRAILILCLLLSGIAAQAQLAPGGWKVIDGQWLRDQSELECFRKANVTQANGYLQLTAKRETTTCEGGTNYGPTVQNYTAGALRMDKFKFTFGTIVTRMKFTANVWLSRWMISADTCPQSGIFSKYGAPNWFCIGTYTEFDMPEYIPGTDTFNLKLYNNAANVWRGNSVTGASIGGATEWHVWTRVWTPTAITDYVDGALVNTITDYIPQDPMFVLFTQEVGSIGGGDLTNLNETALIDYNRVCSDYTKHTCEPGDADMIFDSEFNDVGVTLSNVKLSNAVVK